MTDIWTYRSGVWRSEPDQSADVAPDLTGYTVEADDGEIGKVDEATYDDAVAHLVVDTGWWIFGKKRMIPAGVVREVDRDERIVRVAMTKDDVRGAPDHDEVTMDDGAYRTAVGEYYSPWLGPWR